MCFVFHKIYNNGFLNILSNIHENETIMGNYEDWSADHSLPKSTHMSPYFLTPTGLQTLVFFSVLIIY